MNILKIVGAVGVVMGALGAVHLAQANCLGQPESLGCTVNNNDSRCKGTNGSDVIVVKDPAVGCRHYLTGLPEPCVINGRNGDDSIVGSNGPDTICGGGGSDVVQAGSGNDSVAMGNNTPASSYEVALGEGGNDTLRGQGGNDVLIGGSGPDINNGGSDIGAAAVGDICAQADFNVNCELVLP